MEAFRGQVLVTGGTGFVAGHVIANLLKHGYAVRATVRDIHAATDRAHLTKMARRTAGVVDIVEANLHDDKGWDAALSGCTAVMHIASPIPLRHDPRDFVGAAVAGTLRVLRAAARSPTTRRVVLTSSIAAVDQGRIARAIKDERDWSDPAACGPYELSKTLAEQAAWEFVDQLPPDRSLELVTILPGMVLGPLLRPQMCTSLLQVQRLLSGTIPGAIRAGWPAVDVRDLATAHRRAMESPRAVNQRYLCAGEQLWMADIAKTLAREFGPLGYPVPTRTLPSWTVRLLAAADPEARLTLPVLDRVNRVSDHKIRNHLGMHFRPIEDTIVDTALSLIRHDIVAAPSPGRRIQRLLPLFAGMRP